MPINKVKRYFHASTPKANHMEYNGIAVNKECQGMTLTFEVEPSYISYALDDFQDECLPFTVEGKWHINMTDEEEKSAMELSLIHI